jgi:hypothetical protein
MGEGEMTISDWELAWWKNELRLEAQKQAMKACTHPEDQRIIKREPGEMYFSGGDLIDKTIITEIKCGVCGMVLDD